MTIRDFDKIKAQVRADGVAMTDFFGPDMPAGDGVSMGYAVFPAGTKVPPAAHTGDEYSFILSGRVKCEINGVVQEARAGMASFIPAGEIHASFNDSAEEARLIWMLVERGEK